MIVILLVLKMVFIRNIIKVVLNSCIAVVGYRLRFRCYRSYQRCQQRMWVSQQESIGSLRIDNTDVDVGRQVCPDSFSVAPMMEYTDRHQRTLMRMLSNCAVLYTEMVTTNAIVRSGDPDRFLDADMELEGPIVLQLGGSDPQQMNMAAKMAFDYGYREININCGCPSEKVAGAGCFGAALMLQPELVAELAQAASEGIGRPATIKCRIGVDDQDSYEQLARFVHSVSTAAGVRHFAVHARKAVLGGRFSPHDNRSIPPLRPELVRQLVRDFPHLRFSLNGGILSLDAALQQLHSGVHGVMVGRAVINDPYHWRTVDSSMYNTSDPGLTRREIITKYAKYAASQEELHGRRVRRTVVKPVLNLFHAEVNGKRYRAEIDEYLKQPDISVQDILMKSIECIPLEVLDNFNTIHP